MTLAQQPILYYQQQHTIASFQSQHTMSLQGPPLPTSLTHGIPDPPTILKQKNAYIVMLDKQLKQGVLILDAQVKHQKEYLHAQADQQLKQFDLELTLEVQQQEMQLSQQYVEQTMKLQQQAQQQKSALEQQALQLTMEYEQRKSEEEMALKQFKIDQEQFQMQQRMSLDFSRLSGQQPFQMGGASTLALMGNMNGSYSGFAPPTVMSQYPFQTAISGSLTTTAPAVPAQSYSQRGFNPAGYTPDKQVYVYGANGELIPKR